MDSATPPPPAALHITVWLLPARQVLHRVHQQRYNCQNQQKRQDKMQ